MAEKENTTQSAEAGTPPDAQPEKKDGGKKAKHKGAEAQLAALQEKLTESEQHAGELKENLMRTAAEYDNYRKRSQKEHDAAFGNGIAHAVCQLLPVLDTLEAAANAPTTDEEYKKGVLLTMAKCNEIFEKLGIEEIEAMGQPFDPEVHNAVMQQPCEGAECGTVTKVIQKGYKHGGKVVRHAMVAVAP